MRTNKSETNRSLRYSETYTEVPMHIYCVPGTRALLEHHLSSPSLVARAESVVLGTHLSSLGTTVYFVPNDQVERKKPVQSNSSVPMDSQWNYTYLQHHQQHSTSNNSLILPPGWVQAHDPISGRIYYANVSTNESRWDPPAAPSLPLVENIPHAITAAVSGILPSSTIINTNAIIPSSARGITFPEVAPTHHPIQSTAVSTINSTTATTSSTTNPSSMHLVPNVLSMLQVENQRRRLLEQKQQKTISSGDVTTLDDMPIEEVEFPSLSAGMLADLCRIQQELQDNDNGNVDLYYYKPLDVNKMPMMSKPTQIESGRVDVRISNLMQELQKLT